MEPLEFVNYTVGALTIGGFVSLLFMIVGWFMGPNSSLRSLGSDFAAILFGLAAVTAIYKERVADWLAGFVG
ncbi:hypothetical protein [Nocardioides aurantiacus]|uniref:hypothetical protein n=1 Tax=Nocardioides aurantiacus TaxID=86796 RepID=UPI001FE63016|nr:hypothetical protein [Nocardioides aurantiacus]